MTTLGLFLFGLLLFLWNLLGLLHTDVPGQEVVAHLIGLIASLCLLLGCHNGPLPSFRRPE